MTDDATAAAADEEPLRVVVEISRRDIFFVTFRYIFRSRWLWALFALPFALAMWRVWSSENRPTELLPAVVVAAVFGAFCFGMLLVAALGFAALTVLQVGALPGILGSHLFEIRRDGLFESTSANQTVTNWSAIRSATRTKHYILVSVAWWMLHCIPRRAFADDAAFEAFYSTLQARIGRPS